MLSPNHIFFLFQNNHDRSMRRPKSDEVTLVTGYLNIGDFKKPNHPRYHSRNASNYRIWMKMWSKIHNPVIAYFDNENDMDYFVNIRAKASLLGKTKIIMVNKTDTWAFSLIPQFLSVISVPGYPKHYPDTTNPYYAAVQHAKYEFVERSTRENPFNTNYFAWIDIGIFRGRADRESPFKIGLPEGIDISKVAYTKVWPMKNISKAAIIEKVAVWVSGSFFIGAREPIMMWCRDYMKIEERLLKYDNFASVDQQTVYAMGLHENTSVKVQPYEVDLKIANAVHYNLAFRCKKPFNTTQ